MKKKLAIVTTHPIQYNAPWFRLLAERQKVEVKVFYTWSQSKASVKDRTFGREIIWDIPLLEGYEYEFVENISNKPGSHHFFGIDCPTLIQNIQAFQPDAVLFFGWKFKSHFKAMRHFKGKIPVLFRGDSTLLDESGGYKSKIRRLILKKVYSYIDKALYVGKANKDYFLKHGLKISQLIYAPHAIDNLRFKDDVKKNYANAAQQWRKELGYTENDIVVLFAGKFEEKKQPNVLIEAIKAANLYRTDTLHLLMVGNGPLEESLKEMNVDEGNICFLPFQNQTVMPIVYRLADVFCLPSKGPGETWGLAVNEAMASGKPVIVSSRVGCAEDLIQSNENGYIFDYKDNETLMSILKTLSKDSLNNLGNQAQKDIQTYNFEVIVSSIENEI